MNEIDLCVVGLGYIGLPTATMFAQAGLRVHGVDTSELAVAAVRSGQPHFDEPGMAEMLGEVVETGRLTASDSPMSAAAYILAVPTPVSGELEPDLSSVFGALRSIAPYVGSDSLVILESTSPIGTTRELARRLEELRPDLPIAMTNSLEVADGVQFAYCPERILPGRMLKELRENDRLIGGLSDSASAAALSIYSSFVEGTCFVTTAEVAEAAKLAENAFRDVNIAFANELSTLLETTGVDVHEVIDLANRHPRVEILRPGVGVGGHCIAVDPWFLIHQAGDGANLMKSARKTNDSKPAFVIDQLKSMVGGSLDGLSVGCLGLAYKPDVDDIRESPAVTFVMALLRSNVRKVLVVDPHVRSLPSQLDDDRVVLVELDEVLVSADALAVLTTHAEFVREKLNIDSFSGPIADPGGMLR